MLIDSHCHLDFSEFDQDRTELLSRCQQKGVSGIVIPTIHPQSWQKSLEIASQSPEVFVAVGVHPWYVRDASWSDLQRISEVIENHLDKVVAIGETGLDRLRPDWVLQQDYFEYQLELAKNLNLPVIMHSVKTHSDVLGMLKRIGCRQGVIHAFSGSYEQAMQFINHGMKLGVGGTITYPSASKTRDTFRRVPLEGLVLETDAPSMPLKDRHGQRNSPEYLPEVLEALQELRSESAQQIEQQLVSNTQTLFGNHWPMAVAC